jgi:hypothetical protein
MGHGQGEIPAISPGSSCTVVEDAAGRRPTLAAVDMTELGSGPTNAPRMPASVVMWLLDTALGGLYTSA